ncbi:hypothetical protein COCOBI_18-2330 [Coccomyxa sp. Obi]|nr:hypothetical protein COCOBI_18-2330 [Coccomyxa sp. Obi]
MHIFVWYYTRTRTSKLGYSKAQQQASRHIRPTSDYSLSEQEPPYSAFQEGPSYWPLVLNAVGRPPLRALTAKLKRNL